MQKPFDINTIMEGVDNEILETTHDTFGTRPRSPSLREQALNTLHSESTAPRPPNNQPTVAEDAINPSHYRKHPSGIECIEVTRHMNFNTGNAIKYIWRYLDKGDPIENLKKAQWYLDDEIRRLEGAR